MNLYVNNFSANSSSVSNLFVNSSSITYNSINPANITTTTLNVNTSLTGTLLTITNLNTTNITSGVLLLTSNIIKYKSLPYGLVTGITGQSIPNATDTALGTYWNSTVTSANMSFASGVFTISTAGKYLVTVQAIFIAHATGIRSIYISKNNVTIATVVYGYVTMPAVTVAGFRTGFATSAILDLAATNTVRIYVYQNSGGALSMDTNVTGWFSITAL